MHKIELRAVIFLHALQFQRVGLYTVARFRYEINALRTFKDLASDI